jgi:two-component system, NtrC family, sensor kinase
VSGHEVEAAGGDGVLRAVVVAAEPLATAVADEVRSAVAGAARVDVAVDVEAALASVAAEPDAAVAIVVLAGGLTDLDAAVARIDTSPVFAAASTLLVTDRRSHDDAAATVDRHRLDAIVPIPWTAGALAWHVRSQVVRWLREHRPRDGRLAALTADGDPGVVLEELLGELGTDDVAARLVAAVERALGPRPRLVLPPGTRLTQEGVSVDGVAIVLRGSVALHRVTRVGDLRLHHTSTGPVIGLLALAQQRRAYFTARSTTEVEVVHLSLEQLALAMRTEPQVRSVLATVAIGALARRLRHSEELQIETIELNRELDAERRRLAEALHQLERARLELLAQARFATLGELAAGIAHELNNPVAALTRAASYVAEDVDRLLDSHPRGTSARRALTAARDRRPRSTADERAERRRLATDLDDPKLARRLAAAGVVDPGDARRLAEEGEEAVALVEVAAGIGAAVHNLEVASHRIGELVQSLRAYSRPDAEPVADVDLHAGIDDTLTLTAHRLHGVRVERRYGDVPPIRCHPGRLDQVWTNLLVNAAEELDGSGSIEIVTDAPDPDHVRVRIADDGPGIAPDVLPHVFEPRFTTKQGAVRYGLGLGLAIVRRLVEQHGGTVELTSRPGRTVATVVLPVAGPTGEEAT